MKFFQAFIAAYLLGSISFSVIVSKLYGIDIFKVGSGNAGATNIRRTIGSHASRIVFFLDVLKGVIAVMIAFLILGRDTTIGTQAACIATLGVMCGHSFSIFLKFKGGKGVSVSMGALLVLMPTVALFGAIAWYVIFYATRIVSLGSLCFALSLPLTTYLLEYSRHELFLSFVLAGFLFAMHHANIRRLMDGTETKFTRKTK